MASDGLLRSNSRIVLTDVVPWETKYPVILAHDSDITKMIINHYHVNLKHCAGASHLHAELSRKYWFPKMKRKIKTVIGRCQECRRNSATGKFQKMAPLPEFRVKEPLRAFSVVGVDFAGPICIKVGRGKVRDKRYICLFTCLQSRGIHLELASSLETDAFIRAFLRFMSRRGRPSTVVSDNGTNFVGAVNEIVELKLDNYKLRSELEKHEIRWIFNPPGAPHFGGAYEAMVKSVKRVLNKILPEADVTEEELTTALIMTEGIINGRPLTVKCEDPVEEVPLSPNNLIIAGWDGEHPGELTGSTKSRIVARWRYIQNLTEQFWCRWRKEVLISWRTREKWKRGEIRFLPGDNVWILDENARRGHWKVGRITQVFPGRDGVVRVVDVGVEGKVHRIPVNKLCKMELDEEDPTQLNQ